MSNLPEQVVPPAACLSMQRPQLSVILEERILQDPILAKHFAGLETPDTPELIANGFDILSSPRQLRTSHRLVRSIDADGVKYLNQYIVIKPLGHGNYGKVKLCLDTFDGKLHAIKVVDRNRLKDRRVSNEDGDNILLQESLVEIAILKKLCHPNIVALHEVIDDVHQRKVYLVLEYVEGGPVMETNRWFAISENLVRKYFHDICCGLDYLHYHKILHRDLKPENLLQTADGRIKISDFGVSRVFEMTDAVSSTAGTPAFLAPEVCTKSSYEGRPVDVWALGVCLYVFVFGAVPFPAKTIPETYHAILHNELVFPSPNKISEELQDLLKFILDKDPQTRITLPSIMKHPWLTQSALPTLNPLSSSTLQEGAIMAVSKHELESAYTKNTTGFNTLFNVGVREKKYEPGEYIMRQGEEGNEMFFISSGRCEVLVESNAAPENGGDMVEFVVMKRGPGQFVGEMTLTNPDFMDSPRYVGASVRTKASIRAKTPVTALVLNRSKVMETLEQNALRSVKQSVKQGELQEATCKMHVMELLAIPKTAKVAIQNKSSRCGCGKSRWCIIM